MPGDILPVMPQFNMGHAIRHDIQEGWAWRDLIKTKAYALNPLVTDLPGAVLPLENLVKIGPVEDDIPALEIWYNDEDVEPRYYGELKEILDEEKHAEEEDWYLYTFLTAPDHYTEFILPDGHGLYLMTTAYVADQSGATLWYDNDEDKGVPVPGSVKFPGTRGTDPFYEDIRHVFWYDPLNGWDLYVNGEVAPGPTPDWCPWDDNGIIDDNEIAYAVFLWATAGDMNGHTLSDNDITLLVVWWATGVKPPGWPY
jgi:hypothetical protein